MNSWSSRWITTEFYKRASDPSTCNSSPSLSCCDANNNIFHLVSPTTFTFGENGVRVYYSGIGVSSPGLLYSWGGGEDSGGANAVVGGNPITIKTYFSCFNNCDYSTNLCCNPLP